MKAVASSDPALLTGHLHGWTAEAIAAQRERIETELAPRYRLQEFIDAGAFASVWRAIDTQSGEVVAIKHLRRIARASRDFYAELRSLFVLNHPNVVRWLNLIDSSLESRYLILEHCAGGSLRAVLTEHKRAFEPLTEDRTAFLIARLAAGLAQAHRLGIVHRDLKPENVLFATTGNVRYYDPACPKIADFGLARPRAISAGPIASLTGSPAYMAPEQFINDFSPASDVYSLGIMAYELLHCYRPFEGGHETLARGHCYQQPDFRNDLTSGWQQLLRAMLAKSPADRPTAAELERELTQRAVAGERTVSRRTLGMTAHDAVVRAIPGELSEFVFVTDAGLLSYRSDGAPRAPMVLDGIGCVASDAQGGLWFNRGRAIWHQQGRETPVQRGLLPAVPQQLLATEDSLGNSFLTMIRGEKIAQVSTRQPNEPLWVHPLPGPAGSQLVALAEGRVALSLDGTRHRVIIFSSNGTVEHMFNLPGRCEQLTSNGRDVLGLLLAENIARQAYRLVVHEKRLHPLLAPTPPSTLGMSHHDDRIEAIAGSEWIEWNSAGTLLCRTPLPCTETPLALLSTRSVGSTMATVVLFTSEAGSRFVLIRREG